MIKISELPEVIINPKQTPPEITVRPVVGGRPEAVMTLEHFRNEYPLMKTAFMTSRELYESTNPGTATELGIGPTFEEVLDVVNGYFDTRVCALGISDKRDAGIYFWRQKILDVLETAIRGSGLAGVKPIPILGDPPSLDTEYLRRFQWTGIIAEGKKSHTSKAPCHTELEKQFADFLDSADDVVKYLKNERFGFSVTYYENNRPRQYYPDFVVLVRTKAGQETFWIVETKGEVHPNTKYKREAAELWCAKMSETKYGSWKYLFVQQKVFEKALKANADSFGRLAAGVTQS